MPARIAGVHDGRWLDLDTPVVMEDGESYRLRIRANDGTLRIADVETRPGESRTIVLKQPLTPAPEDGNLVLFDKYGEESVDCIVSRVEPGDDWSARITMLRHAPEIDALVAAETPPVWDGRAGGTVKAMGARRRPRASCISPRATRSRTRRRARCA